ncbi:MAG TPA: peptidoglycan-associated lipoprotein Pal [Oligoflexia bacterium]|nr:peptidoglycan-associated lipoprotein Pal [Oligoflexia bacterium]HMP47728.1 peptidoglycan-associated lipoprotein Pal [Oligoflexia bacterium]
MSSKINFRIISLAVKFSAIVLLLTLPACGWFSSDQGGAGSPDGYGDFEEGSVPMADAGRELADINFDYDSSALTPLAKDILKRSAAWLQKNPGSKVIIEGHCDERGTAEYNLALGERRARAALDYLRSLGSSTSNMSTISYGKELPLDPSQNEAAYAKNRRAHFAVKR